MARLRSDGSRRALPHARLSHQKSRPGRRPIRSTLRGLPSPSTTEARRRYRRFAPCDAFRGPMGSHGHLAGRRAPLGSRRTAGLVVSVIGTAQCRRSRCFRFLAAPQCALAERLKVRTGPAPFSAGQGRPSSDEADSDNVARAVPNELAPIRHRRCRPIATFPGCAQEEPACPSAIPRNRAAGPFQTRAFARPVRT